jgi:caffeoyl-CoA O-methyltransferase
MDISEQVDRYVRATGPTHDEIEPAREFLGRAGLADRAAFEHGDAMEIVDRYDGLFDVVLIDHQKSRYADAFHSVRDRLALTTRGRG